MALDKKEFKLWIKERDEAIRTLDVEKFKRFYDKWKAKGVYVINLPSDFVIEITLYKMLYNLGDATDEEKSKAKEWLESKGCSTEM